MKSNDLTGKQFGKLTVVQKSEKRENHYCTWICRCSCGNMVTISTKKLTRGTIVNCGCEQKVRTGRNAQDLSTRRFGKLTVIQRVDNDLSGQPRWLCKCDCGKETVVLSKRLKSGEVKSCGCLKKNLLDIKGQRFGRLTAMEITDMRAANGAIIWRCRCDCGKDIFVPRDDLLSGNYKSCGCLRSELARDMQAHMTFTNGTCIELITNRAPRSDNTSGYCGVYKTKKNKFRAEITLSGQHIHLGLFPNLESAVQARKDAEETLHRAFVKGYGEWEKRAAENPAWALAYPFHFTWVRADGKKYTF